MSTSTSFRPLNDNEKKALVAIYEKGKLGVDNPFYLSIDRVVVSYERMQGGFCVCIVAISKSIISPLEFGSLVLRGASRRSYKDPRKPIRGEMLAFSRAILYSRPVELS
jgi:hypothetical protein